MGDFLVLEVKSFPHHVRPFCNSVVMAWLSRFLFCMRNFLVHKVNTLPHNTRVPFPSSPTYQRRRRLRHGGSVVPDPLRREGVFCMIARESPSPLGLRLCVLNRKRMFSRKIWA